jgi:hypothetical protein
MGRQADDKLAGEWWARQMVLVHVDVKAAAPAAHLAVHV